MNRPIEATTLLALGLTLRHFAENPTLGDLRMLVHGRLHLWPGWEDTDEALQDAVARFLAVRPDALTDDRLLLERAQDALKAGADFEEDRDRGGSKSGDWDTPYRLVRGRPLNERISSWFAQAEQNRVTPTTASGLDMPKTGSISLVAGEESYRIPRNHLPKEPSEPPKLRTSGQVSGTLLDRASLLALAQRIDAGREAGGKLYEDVGIGAFLDRFVNHDGAQPELAESGVTQLAVAPTGTGKSVFARLLALHLAQQGTPVTLVVPDILSVWKEVLRLREAAKSADLKLSIVPLSSWRNLADRLGTYLDHPPKEDPDATWAIRTVGYRCLLAAYAEADDGPSPGDEPCTRLKQLGLRKGKAREVVCPFAAECGRFSAFYKAAEADIVVVNHHAFLGGRVPIEMSVDEAGSRKLTTAELVFRRSSVLLIDEIDALQNVAIGANSRGLVLFAPGRHSKPHRLLWEVDGLSSPNVRFERGRASLHRITYHAGRLTGFINQDGIDWPAQGRMTWRDAQDAWLTAHLFGDQVGDKKRLARLFGDTPITGDANAGDANAEEALRQALRPVWARRLDGTPMSEVKAAIKRALASWRVPGIGMVPKQQDVIASRLIVRAVLTELDEALEHLRPQLPSLEEHEITQAAELRDDLLGYAPWQPSPVGALGRRMQGYAFAQLPDGLVAPEKNMGALETRIMSGDPQGLIRELGGLVARALAGQRRVVLGLSATCRFRGSPRADVLGEVLGWVRDEARNVSVRSALVNARISGMGHPDERMKAADQVAKELYPTLRDDLQRMMEADPATQARARVLLVTGSYDEAKAVAKGLRSVAGNALAIQYLVSDRDAGQSLDALPRSQIESFGLSKAPAVLIGPLSVVSRGHNILQENSQLSALSGIFVLTRPVPPSHDAGRFLAHVAYNAWLSPVKWRESPNKTVIAERAAARKRLNALQRSPATFRHMDAELRRELICDVLVDLAQLAGRARRGGTPVDLVFVDGAFGDEMAPWEDLVREVLEWWRECGWLDEMLKLHGAFVSGLADYAKFEGTARTPEGVS